MGILLKKLETIKELEWIAFLERKIWGMNPIPIHQTYTAAKNGGIVIGAFEDQQIVGFLYSFPGVSHGETYLCSHMMGIDEKYQNRGIGYLLKMQQAEEARNLGYGKIRWTYDPLESRNAYLNIAKLGAVCSEYIENCYGEMKDELNRGLASDRFNVEWCINSPYLEARHQLFSEVPISPDAVALDWQLRNDGHPQAMTGDFSRIAEVNMPFLLVPAPTEFQKIKQADLELAIDWRLHTRRIFQEAFTAGWVVSHVQRVKHSPIQCYVLVKKETLSFMMSKEKGDYFDEN